MRQSRGRYLQFGPREPAFALAWYRWSSDIRLWMSSDLTPPPTAFLPNSVESLSVRQGGVINKTKAFLDGLRALRERLFSNHGRVGPPRIPGQSLEAGKSGTRCKPARDKGTCSFRTVREILGLGTLAQSTSIQSSQLLVHTTVHGCRDGKKPSAWASRCRITRRSTWLVRDLLEDHRLASQWLAGFPGRVPRYSHLCTGSCVLISCVASCIFESYSSMQRSELWQAGMPTTWIPRDTYLQTARPHGTV